MSEARRGLIRIVTNYVRLATHLALGLALIPVMLRWVGDDAVGVFLLLGGAIALPAIFRELINRGITRELGAALHDDDPATLPAVYNSSLVVSAGATVLTALAFVIMTLVVPLLRIPEHLIWPAQVMVIAQGVYLCFFTLLAPAFNMLMVAERFVAYNIALILERAGYLGAALMLWLGAGIEDPAVGLAQFGILSSVLRGIVLIGAVAYIVFSDPRLRPKMSLVTRQAMRSVASTFGWNSAVQIAMNFHERVALIIMNLAFGIVATSAFGVGIRFVSYVRMATVGVTFGLDAVTARVSKDAEAVNKLMQNSVRMQAFVCFPAAAVVLLLCEPLLRAWIGDSLENPEQVLPLAVSMSQVLVIAITARALSDAWITVLYGAGFVHRYAPLLLAGGLANPFIAVALIWILPEKTAVLAPALTFAGIMIVFHMTALPVIVARCTSVPYPRLFVPFLKPLLATLLCALILVGGDRLLAPLGLLDLALVVGAFGVCYAIVGWLFVLTADERDRFSGALLRRLRERHAR